MPPCPPWAALAFGLIFPASTIGFLNFGGVRESSLFWVSAFSMAARCLKFWNGVRNVIRAAGGTISWIGWDVDMDMGVVLAATFSPHGEIV